MSSWRSVCSGLFSRFLNQSSMSDVQRHCCSLSFVLMVSFILDSICLPIIPMLDFAGLMSLHLMFEGSPLYGIL